MYKCCCCIIQRMHFQHYMQSTIFKVWMIQNCIYYFININYSLFLFFLSLLEKNIQQKEKGQQSQKKDTYYSVSSKVCISSNINKMHFIVVPTFLIIFPHMVAMPPPSLNPPLTRRIKNIFFRILRNLIEYPL